MDRFELWERAHRIKAAAHRAAAAREDMCASAAKAAGAMHRFAEAMQASADHEVAIHPDLAELNVRLDGYYGTA
ncbi:hypothetical protein ACFV1F_16885 [Streptomyces sp. NPDC059590]|uniref:hypothetical protein n=1 Tax=Streptomyces sp. NPDC059590 TaxID=3346877 RepID=UPI0036A71186